MMFKGAVTKILCLVLISVKHPRPTVFLVYTQKYKRQQHYSIHQVPCTSIIIAFMLLCHKGWVTTVPMTVGPITARFVDFSRVPGENPSKH